MNALRLASVIPISEANGQVLIIQSGFRDALSTAQGVSILTHMILGEDTHDLFRAYSKKSLSTGQKEKSEE